jgi:hypothetical protein
MFVRSVLQLLADGVNPGDIVDADETGFLLYPQGFYTWARRGTEAVQINVAGHEKQSHTAKDAVTMDGGKIPLFTIVQGNLGHSEWGLEMDRQGLHVSTHSPSGWMTMPAMLESRRF